MLGKSFSSLLGLCFMVNLTACSGTVNPDAESETMSWEEFQASVFREPDTGIYIVDGDEPVYSLEALRHYYDTVVAQPAEAAGTRSADQPLTVNTVAGLDDKWSDTQKLNITYCISSLSFGFRYSQVVNALNAATADWEGVANVNFVHQSRSDLLCSSLSGVVFNVRQVFFQRYTARAFFPSSSRSARELLIDSSAFSNSIAPWTLTGVIRHELGHVLGFRHEHTRPEAGGTCVETANWRALGPYDSSSVMHYPQCNGTNTGDLVLTDLDKTAAAALYGAP